MTEPWWSPSSVVSLMQNESRRGSSWGDTAYFMQWKGPNALDHLAQPYNSHEAPEFEIGWKSAPTVADGNGINKFTAVNRSGFPSTMKIQWDYTEDRNDAVLALHNLNVLADDQRRNPARYYVGWGRLLYDLNQYPLNLWDRNAANRPIFEAQMGHTDNSTGPDVTNAYSAATLNLVPAENGKPGFPIPEEKDHVYQANMDQAWLRYSNFEGGDADWVTQSAVKTRFCNQYSPLQGSCYEFLRHQNNWDQHTYMGQTATVLNQVNDGNGSNFRILGTGTRTGLQTETSFRCPTYASQDRALYNGNCYVSLYVRGTGDWQRRDFAIPPDGHWRVALVDNWTAQPSNGQTVSYYVDTYGYPMDFDALWLSGGI